MMSSSTTPPQSGLKTMQRVLFFADAGPHVGMGHVNRTRPVFDLLRQKGMEVQMFVPLGHDRLTNLGLGDTSSVLDRSDDICAFIVSKPMDQIVIDSYRYIPEICATVRRMGDTKLVLYDDHYWPQERVQVIVNGSPAAKIASYKTGMAETFLLGPRYTSIGAVFKEARHRFVLRDEVRRVLVSLGGADIDHRIETYVSALDNALPAGVEILVAGAGGRKGRVHDLGWLEQGELARTICECDFAFFAAGSMLAQVACVGLPTAAWPQTDGQRQHAAAWAEQGSVITLGSLAEIGSVVNRCFEKETRRQMSESGRAIVDGMGAGRIAENIIQGAEDF